MENQKKTPKKQKGARGSADHGLIMPLCTVHNLFNSMIMTLMRTCVFSSAQSVLLLYRVCQFLLIDYLADFCINCQFISCVIKKSGQLTHKGGK